MVSTVIKNTFGLIFQDLHMVDLDDFKYGGTNVTAFRLLDPEREEVKQVVQDWIFGEMRYGRKLEPHEQTIKVLLLLLISHLIYITPSL